MGRKLIVPAMLGLSGLLWSSLLAGCAPPPVEQKERASEGASSQAASETLVASPPGHATLAARAAPGTSAMPGLSLGDTATLCVKTRLTVRIASRLCRSDQATCVVLVSAPRDAVFMTLGHLDPAAHPYVVPVESPCPGVEAE